LGIGQGNSSPPEGWSFQNELIDPDALVEEKEVIPDAQTESTNNETQKEESTENKDNQDS
jgi:hypothetical protein